MNIPNYILHHIRFGCFGLLLHLERLSFFKVSNLRFLDLRLECRRWKSINHLIRSRGRRRMLYGRGGHRLGRNSRNCRLLRSRRSHRRASCRCRQRIDHSHPLEAVGLCTIIRNVVSSLDYSTSVAVVHVHFKNYALGNPIHPLIQNSLSFL